MIFHFGFNAINEHYYNVQYAMLYVSARAVILITLPRTSFYAHII